MSTNTQTPIAAAVSAATGSDIDALINAHGTSQTSNEQAIAAFLALKPSEQAGRLANGYAVRECGWAALASATAEVNAEVAEAINAIFSTLDSAFRIPRARNCAKAAADGISASSMVILRACGHRWACKEGILSIVKLTDLERNERVDKKGRVATPAAATATPTPAVDTPDALTRAKTAEDALDAEKDRSKSIAEKNVKLLSDAKAIGEQAEALRTKVSELESANAQQARVIAELEQKYLAAHNRAESLAAELATERRVIAALQIAAQAREVAPVLPEAPKQNGKQSKVGH